MLNGQQIIEYTLSNIPVDAFHQVIIVAANENILSIANRYGINGVINSQPDLGIARSIKMGTELINTADACMYLVSDQPLLKMSTITGMLSAYKKGTILALSSNGKRGNPVIFPASLYGELTSLNINESGQNVINNHLDILELYEIENSTELMDIDTKDDLEIIKGLIKGKA